MSEATQQTQTAGEEEFLGHLYRGGELLGEGKVIEAKDHLEQAFRLRPDNEKGKNLLGLTYFKLGLFERAAELYETLVQENPADPTLRVNLGLVYLKTNALQRAIREFETSVDLAPEHKKAHNYLGLALAQAGEYGRAREHFIEAGSELMAEKMARAISGDLYSQAAPPAPVQAPAAPQEVFSATEERVALPEASSSFEEGFAVMSEESGPPPEEFSQDSEVIAPPMPEEFAQEAEAFAPPMPEEFAQEAEAFAPPMPEEFAQEAEAVAPPMPEEFPQDVGLAALPSQEEYSPAPLPPPPEEFEQEELTVPGFVSPAALAPVDEMRFAEDEGPSAPVIELRSEETLEDSADAATPPHGTELPPQGQASPMEAYVPSPEESFEEPVSEPLPEEPPLPAEPMSSLAPMEEAMEAVVAAEAQAEVAPEFASGGAPRLVELAPSMPSAAEASGEAFEIGPELVVLHVRGELYARMSGFLGMEGTVAFEPLKRRFRGRITEHPFGDGPEQMQRISGSGSVFISAPGFGYHAVELDDESAYFREAAVFAFEERVSFENGRMGGDELAEVLLVHLRGKGKVLLKVGQGGLRSLAIRANRPVTLPATGLVGWYGAVNPRLVGLPVMGPGGAAGTGVELSGEGFALVLVPGS